MNAHSGLGQRPPRTFNVTVSSGSGSQELKFGGSVIALSVKAPSSSATYNLDIQDGDGFVVTDKKNLTGHVVIREEFQCYYDTSSDTGMTLNFTSATNGAYSVRVWFKV
jgi:hypothetical protein